ncbi:VanZ family protein [Streptococcus sp. IsoGale021]|uniref:VanZ family protein n=1 Tax=Streptococcus TaxID=1301 RepID=UPI002000722E|nr:MULTISPECIES: VanZ family protein [Streptococcus]MCY7210151.1 VanZ family protein [Streptococcus anginosus]MCY7212422.1 VanZ family protein [Streptococcus anginosus]MCY7226285.1 VanZ family protein [Streptococcus anginosus]MDQ8694613.1 VanZ family protein [Streptococcus sp. IsoGale021]MDU5128012.1 VanZ family protein [Streptococcus anginosus]
MPRLKVWLQSNGELTVKGRKILTWGSIFYILLLCLMCFLPQVTEEGMETPGIQQFGRIVVLLIPFNSLVNLGQITSFFQLIKVFVQNIMNIFLLSPLIFQLLWLFPNLRNTKRVLSVSFVISLFIECTQILLDILIDANRVFEIDDLWTNTLGGYLAFLLYKTCVSYWKDKFLTSK